MSVVDEIRTANDRYASGVRRRATCRCRRPGGSPSSPAWTPALDPARFLGLEEGDAHVIRNAGGVVSEDALRSLVISHHLLGTQEAVVIGHTDCGMLTFRNEDLHSRLGPESETIDFLPFPDAAARVRQSVETIEGSPLLPDSFGASGFVYDVESGKLEAV